MATPCTGGAMGPRGLGQALQGQGRLQVRPIARSRESWVQTVPDGEAGQTGPRAPVALPLLAEHRLKKRPVSPSPCPLHLFSQRGLRSQGMSVVRNSGGSSSLQNILFAQLQAQPTDPQTPHGQSALPLIKLKPSSWGSTVDRQICESLLRGQASVHSSF